MNQSPNTTCDNNSLVMPDNPNHDYFFQALERIRTKLLDKTRRNRLLNFRESARDVAIMDEMADEVNDYLVLNGGRFRFLSIPDEDGIKRGADEERMRELPSLFQQNGVVDSRHSDNKLQTPFRQKELDRRLRRLYLEHRTVIEETGANNLYLAMGFLRWQEDREDSLEQLAPLMLVPVRLEREGRAGEARYLLAFDDEPLDTNYSLLEKLKHSFDIRLPLLSDEQKPERYWEEVDEAIETKKRDNWQVVRAMTIGLFRFQKQVMWHDLDPNRWPLHSPLVDKDLIRRVLVGPGDTDSPPGILTATYEQDHPDGQLADIRLIRDADSSQFAALVDGLKREDGLVVEGPPGTGKSQTITNLIAASLAEGKTVLFVAEKMAALTVVYKRLEEQGLGDFCLQLHGLKTGKKELLESVALRMTRRAQFSQDLDQKRMLLEEYRKSLLDTSEALSEHVGPEKLPLYEVVWRVEHLRNLLPDGFAATEIPDSANLSFSTFSRSKQLLEDLGNEWASIPDAAHRAWAGYRPQTVSESDIETLQAAILSGVLAINRLQDWLVTSPTGPSMRGAPVSQLYDLAKHSLDELLPALPSGISANLVFEILKNDLVAEFKLLLETIAGYLRKVEEVNQTFDFASSHSDSYAQMVKDNAGSISSVACSQTTRIGDLAHESMLFAQTVTDLERMPDHAVPVLELVGGFARTLSDCRDLAGRAQELGAGPRSLFVYGNPIHSKPIAKALVDEAEQRSQEIIRRADRLGGFDVTNVGGTAALKESIRQVVVRRDSLLPILNSDYRRAKRHIRSMMHDPRQFSRKPKFLNSLSQLEKFCQDRDQFSEDVTLDRALGPLFAGIETEWSRLTEIVNFSQDLRESIGAERAEFVLSDWEAHVDRMTKAANNLGSATSRVHEFASAHPFPSNLWKRPLEEVVRTLGPWSFRVDKARSVLIVPWCNPRQSLEQVLEAAEAHAAARNLEHKVETNARFDVFMERYWRGPDTQLKALQGTQSWIAGRLDFNALDQRLLLAVFNDAGTIDRSRLGELIGHVRDFSSAIERQTATLGRFGTVDSSVWHGGADVDLDRFIEKLNQCTDTVRSVPLITRWESRRKEVAAMGLEIFAKSLAMNWIVGHQCGTAFECSVYATILKERIAAVPILSRFGRETYEGLRRRFAALDKQTLALAADEIAATLCRVPVPPGIGHGPVRNFTEERLLRHEANKKKRHIPLRKLVTRAPNALQVLKPCFLMSPLSVAQFLPPGEIHFDLVVMDEASQIRPEDALGSIARAQRAVIVGDPKQLPPTSVFDSAVTEDDDAEEAIADDTESILDVCLKLFPFRRLRWHYRSEHEDLIRFSNEKFYDGDLIVFPSPLGDSRDFGVHSIFVETPSYRKGRNREEARVVVEDIVNHYRSGRRSSLGVVALNKRQAEEIELLLDHARQDDPIVDKLITTSNESEPLFIKNLENVQGDERDVIYISVTYGPEALGERTFQRFGPINSDLGWRRLNVVATRARRLVRVFTSMKPVDVLVGDGTRRGVHALRDYLEYAETGRIQRRGRPSGRAPESDFEEAVGSIIRNLGYEIELQVGVEGFFIDIGIRHPDRPGEFLMGIECDGATYHSSPSVRDRDRLRQDILESKGWSIYRIWSTSWFHTRAPEIDRLADAITLRLEAERRVVPRRIEEESRIARLETDMSWRDKEPAYESRRVGGQISIVEALNRFWEQNIRPQFPERERSVLSESMIGLLSNHLPETKTQWFRTIPLSLRETLDRRQIAFLPDIFDVISEYT